MSTKTAKRVTKKKLTLTEAAEQWIAAKKRKREADAQINEAAEVLFAHFEKTGRSTYKNLIGFARGKQTRLDTDKLKSYLGEQLSDFQRVIKTKSLTDLSGE